MLVKSEILLCYKIIEVTVTKIWHVLCVHLHGQFAVICNKWMQYADTTYIQKMKKFENHEFLRILTTDY